MEEPLYATMNLRRDPAMQAIPTEEDARWGIIRYHHRRAWWPVPFVGQAATVLCIDNMLKQLRVPGVFMGLTSSNDPDIDPIYTEIEKPPGIDLYP